MCLAMQEQDVFEISEEAIEQLLSMGFEEASAREALRRSRNDVQSAIARLL